MAARMFRIGNTFIRLDMVLDIWWSEHMVLDRDPATGKDVWTAGFTIEFITNRDRQILDDEAIAAGYENARAAMDALLIAMEDV